MRYPYGEISPTTRVPEVYQGGFEKAEGWVCTPEGTTTVPGDFYAANTKSNVKARNHEFVYSQDDTYIMEFGPLYIRFYRNDAVVFDPIATTTPYEVTTTYTADELEELSFEQEEDVLYITHNNHQRAKLVRFDHNNWVLSDLEMVDGPFLTRNSTAITITSDAITGSVALTASDDVFESGNVNGLYRLEHDLEEQKAEGTFTAPGQATASVYVQKGNSLQVNVPETYTGTIEVQYGPDDATWEIYETYVSTDDNPISINFVAPDDQYTRLYCSALTSGTPEYFLGAQAYRHIGVVRIDTVTDAQNATGTVLTQIGATTATTLWSEGSWSTRRGFPATSYRTNNRLCHAASKYEPNKIWESVGGVPGDPERHRSGTLDTDAFQYSLPGIKDPIRWVQEEEGGLKVGTLKEIALYRPVDETTGATPLNRYKLHRKVNFPCSYLPPVSAGFSELVLSNGGKMIGELRYSEEAKILFWDDKTRFCKHILQVDDGKGIVDMAFMSRPYQILWCVRSDGEVLPFWFDRNAGGNAFTRANNIGKAETISVIPKETYDQIWMVKRFTVNGSTVRHQVYQDELNIHKPLEDIHLYESGLTYEGGSANIISVSKAAQCVVTLDAWPTDGTGTDMVDGDNIWIQGGDMTELNNQIYTVSDANSTAKTLKLKDITNTFYINTTTYSTYTTGGTLEERDNTFTNLSHLEGEEVYVKVGVLQDGVLNMQVVTATVSSGTITLNDYYRYVSAGKFQPGTLRPMPLEGKNTNGIPKHIKGFNIFVFRTMGGTMSYINRQGNPCMTQTLDWSKLSDPQPDIENTGLLRIDTSSGAKTRIRTQIESDGLPMTILDIQVI